MERIRELTASLPTATWLAILSLVIALASLVVSLCRQHFDQRLMGERTATRVKLLLHRRRDAIREYKRRLPEWEQSCKGCRYREQARFDKWRAAADRMDQGTTTLLTRLEQPAGTNSAISLERLLADVEVTTVEMERLAEEARGFSIRCPDRESSNEDTT